MLKWIYCWQSSQEYKLPLLFLPFVPLLFFFYFALLGGSSLPHSRRAMSIVPQQRHLPVLLPLPCQYGGCSRVCCRLLWRKSRYSVARLVLAAVHFGDNIATVPNKRQASYLTSFKVYQKS